jgi:hypothetical protein
MRRAFAISTLYASLARGPLASAISQLTHLPLSDIVSCIRQMHPRAYAKCLQPLLTAGCAFVRLLAAPSTPFKLQAVVQ